MATVSYDAQSFSVEGRRVWLVSGEMHYARIARDQWADRIRAAREAGLNCIETPVFWNLHEPAINDFDFTGELDLRHFVELCGELGMWVILRPGPFVDGDWDMGGLPSHLLNYKGTKKSGDMKLREGAMPFLEAMARYLRAVMEQVRDLQVTHEKPNAKPFRPRLGTTPGSAAGGWQGQGNGPILLMQAEHQWFCTNDAQEDGYLRQVVRHLQEHGCEVPILNTNNLWQRVDGTIDCWGGGRNLPANMRQIATLQTDAPRMVNASTKGQAGRWGKPAPEPDDADALMPRLAGILGVGSQFNIDAFHGGTTFGFWGGRSTDGRSDFAVQSHDLHAPLGEAGARTDAFFGIKQISHFASHFGSLFANLDAFQQPTALAPFGEDHDVSVLAQRGRMGDVILLVKSHKSRRSEVELLLPDGRVMPVTLGSRRASWVVLNADLDGAATLDFTNLCPWAMLDRRMLVVFGPAKADGIVSINDTPLHVKVPSGKTPLIEHIDDITLVVLNEQQVDVAYPTGDGLVIGAAGLDADGNPLPDGKWSTQHLVALDGKHSTSRTSTSNKPRAPKLVGWTYANTADFVTGFSPRYTPVKQLGSLGKLEQGVGYGWYRLPRMSAVTGKLIAPLGGDRLHLFTAGERLDLLGLGPGAKEMPASTKLPKSDLVVLVDNLGRASEGMHLGRDLKGLPFSLQPAKSLKVAQPELEDSPGCDPFEVAEFAPGFRRNQQVPASKLTWKLKLSANKPVLMRIDGLTDCGVIHLNEQPFAIYGGEQSGHYLDIYIDPSTEPGKTGVNYVTLTFDAPLASKTEATKAIKFLQLAGPVHDDAQPVAFAGFEVPVEAGFDSEEPANGLPGWSSAEFEVKDTRMPLWLEPAGMTKGQIYLNSHNVGRYWVHDANGKAVPPQRHYYLPEGFLKTDSPNRLVLFDEHGKKADKCKLVYSPTHPDG